jgi:serine/threonine protein kinase
LGGVNMEQIKPGTIWGRYELVALVGKGGMGDVFRAYDPGLKRYAAIKILRKDDPVVLKRFLQEARAQAKVDHENVCKVYEAGEFNEHPYIAMQFIEGKNLKQMSGELNLEEKIRILSVVAMGLHAAHTTGLVHRDIKPENIMVSQTEDGQWKPFLMDFGIAREQTAPGLTSTGLVIGTPFYMSPEHVRGIVTEIDRRSDIYSLGVTLYEMLGDCVPFPGDTPMEILMKILQREPKPLRKLNPRIPIDLETIIMKCLEKEPNRRYTSAKELADDLKNYLDGEPINARPSTIGYRLKRKLVKHRASSAIAFAALLVIIFLLGLWIKTGIDASGREVIARELGQEVNEIENTARYARLLPIHDISREKDIIRKRIVSIESKMKNLGKLGLGPGHYAIGQGFMALREFDKAREHLQKAFDLDYYPPGAALVMGEVLGELFQEETGIADRIEDETLRAARHLELEKLFLEPALRFLTEGITNSESSSDYFRALVAFYKKDYVRALNLIQSDYPRIGDDMTRQTAAKILEGNIHFAKTRDAENYRELLPLLDKAQEAFREVTRISESDIRGYRGLLRCIERKISFLLHTRQEDIRPLAAEADALCLQALRVDPSAADIYVAKAGVNRWLARYLVFTGQDPTAAFDESRRAAEQALHLQPDNFEAFASVGAVERYKAEYLIERGLNPTLHFQFAVKYFLAAVNINPTYSIAYHGLGTAYFRIAQYAFDHGKDGMEMLNRSILFLEKAISYSPQLADSHNSLGLAWIIHGGELAARGKDPRPSYMKAAESLDNTISLTPNVAYIYNNRGFVTLEIARCELDNGQSPIQWIGNAKVYFDKAGEINTKSVESSLGHIIAEEMGIKYNYLMKRGFADRVSAARTYFNRGISLNPRYAQLYSRMAGILVFQALEGVAHGQSPAAVLAEIGKLRDKAIAINPGLVDSYILDARQWIIKAEWAGMQKRGTAAAAAFKKARSALDKAYRINAKDIEIYQMDGILSLKKALWEISRGGDFRRTVREGLETLGRAFEINDRYGEFYALKGILLKLTAQDEKTRQETRDIFNEAIRINKNLEPRYAPLFDAFGDQKPFREKVSGLPKASV